jgi:hypothetical protein
MESRELSIVRWSLVTALQVLVDLDSALRFFVGFFFSSWNQLGRMDSMEAMRLVIRTLEVGYVDFFWIRIICHHCGVI